MADPHKGISNKSKQSISVHDAANTDFSLAVKLPLSLDGVDGYTAIKNYRDLAKQNLKMLILTAPGERAMDPEFGVGLRNFLFEQNHVSTHGEIEARILNQTRIYLPYIDILRVDFSISTDEHPEPYNSNLLHIVVNYHIKPLDIYDGIDLSVSRN